jgi:hypothetical protein
VPFYSPDEKRASLPMYEVLVLDAMGVFDRFKALAEQSRTEVKAGGPRTTPLRKIFAIDDLVDGVVHVVLTLDLRRNSKKQLARRFENMLDLPQIKKLRCYRKQSPGLFKDRLKDLAAAILYRVLGARGANDFAEEHRLHDSRGAALPFHDPRTPQGKKTLKNEALLYTDQPGFLQAEKRAEAWLARLMPWEENGAKAGARRFSRQSKGVGKSVKAKLEDF